MDRRLLLCLFRKLVDLIRLLGQRSLHCLLRILSALSFRQRAACDYEKHEEKRALDLPACTDSQPVVIACSSVPSTPRKPPPARAYTKHTTLELYGIGPTCTSPTMTLRELPGPISPTSSPTDNHGNLNQQVFSSPETLTALPAGLIAPPEKPMKTMLPSETSRYDRNIAIENNMGPWIFGPLETFTVYDDLDVPNWTHYIQPEGQLYFLNASRAFRFLTEEHLCDESTLAEAELFISVFERKAESFKNLPYNVEVVFELHKDCWMYYMVDLDSRRLFWLDDCIIDDNVLPLKYGVENREHLRHMFDFEYWEHVNYFPNHRPLQEGLLEELMGILLQLHIDVVTSLTSTSAYDGGELKSLIGSVKRLQSLQKKESSMPYVVQSSARLMSIIANERFYNFSGFHGARLSNVQSVRGDMVKKRSPLITLLSPILFYAPEVHLAGLEKVWVDSVVKDRHWKAFQGKVERDWEGFVLYATVLVNANVAFLAIPSVISDDLGPGLMMSPAGIVSQVSIIASLGSIIVGLLLVRQMRIGAKDSAEDHLAFLENRTHPQLGLETLAILFSLPYALLMWGMATFLAAVAIICFYNMGGSVSLAKRIIYGIVWLFVLLFILWTVLTGWEKEWLRERPSPAPGTECDEESSKSTDQEMELETFENEADSDKADVRSIRSRRSARSRFTASSTLASSITRSWRSRVRKITESPKKRSLARIAMGVGMRRRDAPNSDSAAHLESGRVS